MAALKKMLPIGLNMCTPGDQELISLAKTRYGLVRLPGLGLGWGWSWAWTGVRVRLGWF